MKRPLYYLICAIACTSMVSSTMPMAAIAEAMQPQETAEQQAQADTTSSDTGKAEDGTDTNATADTVEDGAATSTGTSAVNTESADSTAAATGTTATPGTTAATGIPTPSLRTQTNPAPAAISATSQTGYAHSATATQNGVTFTVSWNDAPAGTATTFHVTQANGSSQAKARMDVPTYWDGGSQESVCDPSRAAWGSYYSLGTAGHDFTFDFTASGTYRIYFYFMDNDRNDPQNDKGIYYLRTTAEVTVNGAARTSVTQIVYNAVAQCRQETNGSEYDMALWLHDWTLDQLEYDHSLNWCSAESGLTRHQGTCESYQRIYSKLLDAAGIANGRITGNGHTWNAVKIDGKWCQMDLTWDDTSDNWYGDLDQRHLYFGLTDELMAIAHSDHTANYQKDRYAYRSTDLSNNYFVRNGKADEWAEKYADRIQQHLDAKEESFSIDADNQSFPPSISGIQNGIVAYAMNLMEWETNNAKVNLTATSSVTTQSSSKWAAFYDFEAKYTTTTPKGWRLENSIWYYLNADGSYATGWRTIDGSRYYFEDSGAMATGWTEIGGKRHLFTSSGRPAAKGWLLLNGTWYYVIDDGEVATGWRKVNNAWYLFDDNGEMATGWREVSGKLYYLADSGKLASPGWLLLGGTWFYIEGDGSAATGWQTIDGARYYFEDDGAMATGWKEIDGKRHLLTSSGRSAAKGWLRLDGIWYYVVNDGEVATGWRKVNNSWYLFNNKGEMLTGWQELSGKRYYLTDSGKLVAPGWLLLDATWFYIEDDGSAATGWRKVSGAWYLLENDGSMVTGWYEVSGKRYYLTESGRLAPSGWMQLEGAWYYVQTDGSIATDCWIGSYYVDKTGKWIPAAQK